MINIKNKDEDNISKCLILGKSYYNCIDDLIQNESVLKMNRFIQHGNTTCLEHCINVSYMNYKICKALNFDYKSAARAGLLHDFFLYDWHIKKNNKFFEMHAFTHSRIALVNAEKIFNLNDIEKDMIIKHMWPVNIKLPKYKETYVIIISDKVACMMELIKLLDIKNKVLKFRDFVMNSY